MSATNTSTSIKGAPGLVPVTILAGFLGAGKTTLLALEQLQACVAGDSIH